jgi:hypothetical protein
MINATPCWIEVELRNREPYHPRSLGRELAAEPVTMDGRKLVSSAVPGMDEYIYMALLTSYSCYS